MIIMSYLKLYNGLKCLKPYTAQPAEAVEYVHCNSAEGWDHLPTWVSFT